MASRATRSAREDGESLLEILMAIAIVGTCFAAVLAGIGTTVVTSGLKQQQALDTSYVRGLAERIEAQDFRPCTAGPPDYSVQGVVPTTSGFTVAVSKVEHWSSGSYGTSCPAVDLLQRITLVVTAPDRRSSEPPLVLLKRAS